MNEPAETRDTALKFVLSTKDMTPKDARFRPDSQDEGSDAEVVAMIRPLPGNVVPSERFLAQMRGRLLLLQATKAAARKQAA
jgi:hypothetical protein